MSSPEKLLGPRSAALWIAAGALGALLVAWAYPRVFPLHPQQWQTHRSEAIELALEHARDLGEPLERPYVVANLVSDSALELRLLRSPAVPSRPGLKASRLAQALHYWRVRIYPRGASNLEWRYQVLIALDGTLLGLQRGVAFDRPAEPPPSLRDARLLAGGFLRDHGIDLAEYQAPVERTVERPQRTDLYLRYLDRERWLGDELDYGFEVRFAGDQLLGYHRFTDDPGAREIERELRAAQLSQTFWVFVVFLIVPFVAVVFVRRYHQGLVGVQRALHLFVVVLVGCGTVLVLTARAASEGVAFGALNRAQITWAWMAIQLLIYLPALALLGFVGWSVGESLSRAARWRAKLAAFDALCRGAWGNATVAASTLRGTAGGLLLAGAMLVGGLLLGELGATTPSAYRFGPWWEQSAWPGVALVVVATGFNLAYVLFGRLLLLPPLVDRAGPWLGGLAVALFTALVSFPALVLLPIQAGVPLWLLYAAGLVVVFLRWDLLATLLAALVSDVVLNALPLMRAEDPFLQFQGWLAPLLASAPLWASLRFLGSERRYSYSYEDVPPHVRRIAERERQRIELETARRIQSSILPELPRRIAGVEVAHRYLPATEVGGDFYNVMELDGGRLSLAIGDVAGHGVSSGLVMSMARSALLVQVTYEPEVEAVFRTLNRVIYQSAQRRLLTTLCYALLDPGLGVLTYASAGHLYPYRVSRDGQLETLESAAYPLGVREELEIRPRTARLAGGDSVFLSSDGLVEARRPDSDEPFGFERLEQSLRSHAHRGASGILEGVLEDLGRFLGDGAPRAGELDHREDDLTVLVLTLPV